MLGLIGENRSDTDTLRILCRRFTAAPNLPIRQVSCRGGGNIFRAGARHLRLLAQRGCNKIILCHDADGPEPESTRARLQSHVLNQVSVNSSICLLVPVQAIEAWLLADVAKAQFIFADWPVADFSNPERVPAPRSYLERLSRNPERRTRYVHTIHNARLAEHIDLNLVVFRCPSIVPLQEFLRGLS